MTPEQKKYVGTILLAKAWLMAAEPSNMVDFSECFLVPITIDLICKMFSKGLHIKPATQ